MSFLCNDCETVSHCSRNGCIPKVPAPRIRAESEFMSLYRYFRNKCHMGRWKAFRRAFDCWSPI